MGGGKFVRLGGVGQVGIQHEHVRIAARQLDERIAKDIAQPLPQTPSSIPSSAATSLSSSLVGTFECHSYFPSVNRTPLPLMVRARIKVGRSEPPKRLASSSVGIIFE